MKKKKIKNIFLVKHYLNLDLKKIYVLEKEKHIREKGLTVFSDIMLKRTRAIMYAEWLYPINLDIAHRLKRYKTNKEEYRQWYKKHQLKIFLYQLYQF